uniref:Putative ribonuclease H-like domain-containing protein n=1 Tax=Tanacetum cinerariifolium TaxID=118510 RepID=A0A6L2KZM5_TANCI|nr:putative ribonuclease H-like domain-containing protein [Tanacetum cinerariifolium]
MAFISTPSTSNNDDVITVFGVSTASPQVSTANLSDATMYAFLANQPNGSQLMHKDQEQIHKDDMEEIDLKWQLALLSMRDKRFFQKTAKKITINGSDTVGYNKAKVESFNCHKMGHFAREYRNRVLVVKPHLKTPYELFRGRTSALSFMRPFGCHVTILNTLDHLGKFDGKSDEGFFVAYSTNSKAFRIYNTRIRKVEENLHINFLENKPIIVGDGPKWLFDINALIKPMNYVPVITGTNSNDFVGKRVSFDACQSSMKTGHSQDYILMPLWNDGLLFDFSSKDSDGENKDNDGPCKESEIDNQERPNAKNNTKDVNTIVLSINTASSNINTASSIFNTVRQSDDFFGADTDMRSLDGVEVDISNISTTYPVPTTLNKRIHKDHSLNNVISDIQFGVQTRRMTVTTDEQGFISAIYEEKTHENLDTCLFACFLSQEEPKRITNALKDPTWVEAMQEELLIEEEVYVCQPLGFDDPDYPDKVYKVEKALYGLHQAPRAWFKYADVKPASTLIDKEKVLLKDSDGDDVDVHLYRFMIGSLMYLRSSRPEIMFACKKQTMVATSSPEAEYSAAASCCGQTNICKRSTINMIEFDIGQEDDKVCSSQMFWRTTSVRTLNNGEIELNAIVDGQDKTITEASIRRHHKLADPDGISTLPTNEIFKQLALIGKPRTRTRIIRIRIPQSSVQSSVADEAITKDMHDGLERATTTASSLEAKHGSGNISKTQTKATPSGPSSPRTSSEGGLGCHVTIRDSPVQDRTERLSNLPNEPSLREDKKDSPKQGRMIKEINEDENINLVKSSKQGVAHKTAGGRKESDDTKAVDFSIASPQKDDDVETLAETLVSIKKSAAKDKGKAIIQESEPLKKIKKKEIIQISLDEEIAQMFYEEEQAHLLMDEEYAQQIQADEDLAQTMLKEERKSLSIEERESIRNFVLMESEDQIADSKAGEGSSKEGESLKRPVEEELGQEHQKKQQVKEEIV